MIAAACMAVGLEQGGEERVAVVHGSSFSRSL
jgi:hypothetical protein